MEAYWWGPQMFAWMWIFPLSFLGFGLFYLPTCVDSRGALGGRRNRRELSEAMREILERRYASGEIGSAQYEKMKRVLLK